MTVKFFRSWQCRKWPQLTMGNTRIRQRARVLILYPNSKNCLIITAFKSARDPFSYRLFCKVSYIQVFFIRNSARSTMPKTALIKKADWWYSHQLLSYTKKTINLNQKTQHARTRAVGILIRRARMLVKMKIYRGKRLRKKNTHHIHKK